MNNTTKWLLGLTGICAAAVAAYLIVQNRKEKENRDKPPKGAPQLHLEHPGTQSDFPTSATESEVG